MKRRGRDYLRMVLLPLRMCAGKRAFATAAEAVATNSGQKPYRCPLCGRFPPNDQTEEFTMNETEWLTSADPTAMLDISACAERMGLAVPIECRQTANCAVRLRPVVRCGTGRRALIASRG